MAPISFLNDVRSAIMVPHMSPRFHKAVWPAPILILLLALPPLLQAQFNYTTQNGFVTITKYVGSGVDVTVPNTINNLPVTSIGNSAFATSVTLKRVTIPDTVTSIGSSAFTSCLLLTNITLPSTVTNIGASAFYSCHALTGISLPPNLCSIADSTFQGCLSLQSISIPDSVTNIGYSAFEGCRVMTGISIGTNLTRFSVLSFEACTNLTNITVDPLNPFLSSLDGVIFNKSETTLLLFPAGRSAPYRA